MSNDQDAWMPLWIGSYLADTGRFTTEQHGAYLLIIMDYWREGPPPNDDDILACVAKVSPAQWKKIGPAIKAKFKAIDGVLHHKRIDEELANAKTRAEAASKKAKAAADARWKDKPKKCSKHAPSMPDALPEDMHEECPTPSPNTLSNTESNRHSGSSNTSTFDDNDVPANWESWRGFFEAEQGIAHDPHSINDRKKFRPLAQGWVTAGVSIGFMRNAIAKARRETTEAIAYLPAYVDRVIATMQTPGKGGADAQAMGQMLGYTSDPGYHQDQGEDQGPLTFDMEDIAP